MDLSSTSSSTFSLSSFCTFCRRIYVPLSLVNLFNFHFRSSRVFKNNVVMPSLFFLPLVLNKSLLLQAFIFVQCYFRFWFRLSFPLGWGLSKSIFFYMPPLLCLLLFSLTPSEFNHYIIFLVIPFIVAASFSFY